MADRVLGVIFGAALGDCIGLYTGEKMAIRIMLDASVENLTEFLSRESAEAAYPARKFSLETPVTEFRSDSHRVHAAKDKFELKAWTDDTDHALLILLSYLRNNGQLLPRDFAARLRSWCEQGLRCLDRLPLGLGKTVSSVVLRTTYLQDPEGVAYASWVNSGRNAAANGSLMRNHPLSMMCLKFPRQRMLETVTTYSRLTHPDPRCVLACCVEAAVIADILNGKLKSEDDLNAVIEECYQWVLENYHPDPEAADKKQYLERAEFERYCHASSCSSLELDDSQKIGYVYKCLGAGLFSLRLGLRHKTSPASDVFEDVITALVLQGGDADTNACCAGAMLGAWLGYALLPSHWRGGIMHSDWLVQKTNALCQVAGISENEGYDGLQDPDTMPDEERGLLTREQLDQREKALWIRLCEKDKLRREKEQAGEASSRRKRLWGIFSR